MGEIIARIREYYNSRLRAALWDLEGPLLDARGMSFPSPARQHEGIDERCVSYEGVLTYFMYWQRFGKYWTYFTSDKLRAWQSSSFLLYLARHALVALADIEDICVSWHGRRAGQICTRLSSFVTEIGYIGANEHQYGQAHAKILLPCDEVSTVQSLSSLYARRDALAHQANVSGGILGDSRKRTRSYETATVDDGNTSLDERARKRVRAAGKTVHAAMNGEGA